MQPGADMICEISNRLFLHQEVTARGNTRSIDIPLVRFRGVYPQVAHAGVEPA